MTDDKEFKQLVRTEARRSGRRYTEVRAGLRAPSASGGRSSYLGPYAAEPLAAPEVAVRVATVVETIDSLVFGHHDIGELVATALVTHGNVLLKGGSGNGMTALGEAVAAAIGARIVSIDGRDGLGSAPPESWRSEDVVVIAHLDGLEPSEQVAVIGAGKLPAIVLAKCNPTPGRMPYPPDDDTRERFLVGGILGYPDRETALQIIEIARNGFDTSGAEGIGLDELDRMRAAAGAVVMPAEVDAFVVDAVEATRRQESVLIGGSVVALLDVVRVASAIAVSAGRTEASIEDVAAALAPVLAHRLVLADGADPAAVIQQALEEAQATRV